MSLHRRIFALQSRSLLLKLYLNNRASKYDHLLFMIPWNVSLKRDGKADQTVAIQLMDRDRV